MTLSRILPVDRKHLLVFGIDVVLIGFAFSAAFLLRFDFRIPANFLPLFWQGLTVVMLVKPIVFLLSGLYLSLWRYTSLHDGITITKVVSLSTFLAGFVLMYLRHFAPYPRSILLLDWILLLAMVVASRLIWRFHREAPIIPRRSSHKGRRTMVVGAGEAGSMLIGEIRRQKDSPYTVIGLVDDDISKHGMLLHGIPVLGEIRQLQSLIQFHSVEYVIIALPSVTSRTVHEIVRSCERSKVRFKTISGINEIVEGRLSVSQIKDVEIEDLLGRPPVKIDEDSTRNYLKGKHILITGAAGSIGSEISRQVCRYAPARLVLLDSAETPLYHIEKELVARFPNLCIIPVIADIRQIERISFVFADFLPQVVFHAAAYKHVPMMEYNPVEAVSNNVGGTVNLVNAALGYGVESFVMVSTDKAVNPTNVMGASKRAAELYLQALSQESCTRFTTVRFGNVLGSNGSVIPLFKEQILRGGPVTVTDSRIIRYFMTIPEACQLVLQAGCLGQGGDIFVLDMGEPIRILDLAEELIRLSGLVPHEDIEIVFSGLRPGEKLYEELQMEGEVILPTCHEKIRVVAAVKQDAEEVRFKIKSLLAQASSGDSGLILEGLKITVPEFARSYNFSDESPSVFRPIHTDVISNKFE